jgi:bifunctional non-homologous end joining protein LigD
MKKDVLDVPGLSIKEYKRKRDFRQTAEPPPRVASKRTGKALLFVIQKHAATRLHYDFRIELDGVLKSWAVPKGLPLTRGDKRLAVHVEDHPMDYARFEGTIPPGNYGAGTVMVWDIGTYSIKVADPVKALADGKFHIVLSGKKLKGEWAFVRMKPRAGEKESWLIFKVGEDTRLAKKKEDESVLTGRTMQQIAGENSAQWQSDRSAATSKKVDPRITAAIEKRRARLSPAGRETSTVSVSDVRLEKLSSMPIRFVEPMKCKLVETPPSGNDWIYEIKFDGFRALALKDGDDVQLISRSNKSLTSRFSEIADAVQKLPFERGILDGEIVALDDAGRTSFQLLQNATLPGQRGSSLAFYVFDLINLEGKDLRNLELAQRKKLLQPLIAAEHEPIRFSASIHGDAARLLEEITKRGMEGIIAKKLDSKYESGLRTGCWKKIKVVNEQEFVIGGYTEPKGSRDRFGAILTGYFKAGKLMFVSKVGTGFNQALLDFLYKKFQPLLQDTCPFANLPEKRSGRFGQGLTASEMRKCTWIEPKLVCEIRYTEWTRDDHLRHPVFLGLRDDKKAEEVGKEKPS